MSETHLKQWFCVSGRVDVGSDSAVVLLVGERVIEYTHSHLVVSLFTCQSAGVCRPLDD